MAKNVVVVQLCVAVLLQTASGIIFVTLEDEHGLINVIVWRHVAEAQRRPLLQARLLEVEG